MNELALLALFGILYWALYILGIIDWMRGEGYWANRNGHGKGKPERTPWDN